MVYSVNNRIYRISDRENGYFGRWERALAKAYYERMDIVLVEFGEDYQNCVIGDFRPSIVISKTEYNMCSPVMQVIPLTKQLKAVDKEYHVFVDCNDCEGFQSSGMCLVEQITTIDRRQVKRKIAKVTDDGLIAKISHAVREHLGVGGEVV